MDKGLILMKQLSTSLLLRGFEMSGGPRLRQAIISTLTALMICVSQARSEHLIEVDYWIGPSEEVALYFESMKEFYYFSAPRDGACFTFKLSGDWVADTNAEGWFLGSNPQRYLGIILLSEQEIGRSKDKSSIHQAAQFVTRLYERDIGTADSETKTIDFPSDSHDAVKWSGVFLIDRKKQLRIKAEKVLVELLPGYVAQITAVKPRGDFDDGLARDVLRSISATNDRDCYWPFLKEHVGLRRP